MNSSHSRVRWELLSTLASTCRIFFLLFFSFLRSLAFRSFSSCLRAFSFSSSTFRVFRLALGRGLLKLVVGLFDGRLLQDAGTVVGVALQLQLLLGHVEGGGCLVVSLSALELLQQLFFVEVVLLEGAPPIESESGLQSLQVLVDLRDLGLTLRVFLGVEFVFVEEFDERLHKRVHELVVVDTVDEYPLVEE